MDIHVGNAGFFVEKLGDQHFLGYYDAERGIEHARAVSPVLTREFKALAREAVWEYGQSCGNGVCERRLEAEGQKGGSK